MIISINPEKAFYKIKHPLMIKYPNKLGEGNFLNLINCMESRALKDRVTF